MSDNIKQGDEFNLQRNLEYGNGSAIDLSSASRVLFYASKYGAPETVISIECSILDAANGVVSCPFTVDDTAIIGMYRASFIIEGIDDEQLTVPSTGNYWLHIEQNDYPL